VGVVVVAFSIFVQRDTLLRRWLLPTPPKTQQLDIVISEITFSTRLYSDAIQQLAFTADVKLDVSLACIIFSDLSVPFESTFRNTTVRIILEEILNHWGYTRITGQFRIVEHEGFIIVADPAETRIHSRRPFWRIAGQRICSPKLINRGNMVLRSYDVGNLLPAPGSPISQAGFRYPIPPALRDSREVAAHWIDRVLVDPLFNPKGANPGMRLLPPKYQMPTVHRFGTHRLVVNWEGVVPLIEDALATMHDEMKE
jgi:hypothetical protein